MNNFLLSALSKHQRFRSFISQTTSISLEH